MLLKGNQTAMNTFILYSDDPHNAGCKLCLSLEGSKGFTEFRGSETKVINFRACLFYFIFYQTILSEGLFKKIKISLIEAVCLFCLGTTICYTTGERTELLLISFTSLVEKTGAEDISKP